LKSNNSWSKTSKSSAKRHCLKVLRIWRVEDVNKPGYTFQREVQQQSFGAVNFDLVTFVPRQLTTSGCCGANKALFATSRDTVEKISDWMNRSGKNKYYKYRGSHFFT